MQENTSGIHLWLLLWKASRSLDAHSERHIARLGMCRSDFGVLEALLHKGPLPVNVLGEKVLLTSGSITTAVDRLVKRGLVERRYDAKDRRIRVVQLTKAGEKTIRPAFADHKQAMEEAVEGLSERERSTLIGLLRRTGREARAKLDKQDFE